jgi:hypothetical protein
MSPRTIKGCVEDGIAVSLAFPIDASRFRLRPPKSLTKAEQEVFAELAAQASHLRPADAPLLASLAQAILLSRKLARDPSKAKEWDRTARTQMALTRALRMTPQSRIDARAAGRQHSSPSYYDIMRTQQDDEDQ